ncbi:DNA polymerase III subunit delta [Niabella terrae]
MSVENILNAWQKREFKPVYWLEGEEEYYIDQLVDYAEHRILDESEASFNLTVFYGKDAQWADILNACRKYPMFSDRQVVLLKEAQQMRELDKLEPYLVHPLASTVFVVAYKEKKLDSRTRFAKLVKEKSQYFYSKKISESALPGWVQQVMSGMGYTMTPKATALIVDHIGNDLSRIKNELDKILINLKDRKSVTEEDVERFVGISKEFNAFEFRSAISEKNMAKATRIIRYFGDNPKSAPMQMILPTLYAFFSKVYMLFGSNGNDNDLARQMGVSPYFLKDYQRTAKTYGYTGVEKILLLLHQYNLKLIGVDSSKVKEEDLLKELVVKIML